jgi:hypothetical protein
MTKKLKRKEKIAIICILTAILFLVVASYLANGPGLYIHDINKGYSGIIINKYMQHVNHLTIRTTGHDTLDVALLSDSLVLQSRIGDSIEKTPEDNYVILNSNGQKRKLLYKHIPDYIRKDRRWPAKWKDLWYDNDQK